MNNKIFEYQVVPRFKSVVLCGSEINISYIKHEKGVKSRKDKYKLLVLLVLVGTFFKQALKVRGENEE